MDAKDLITLIGICVSFLIGLSGLIIGIMNSKKTIFINSITSLRTKWLADIKTYISEFCGIAYHLRSVNEINDNDKRQLRERMEKLKFLIKLNLNPNDTFDHKLIDKINMISQTSITTEQLNNELNAFIELSQKLAKIEWEGIKLEALKGNLSKKEKKKLIKDFLE